MLVLVSIIHRLESYLVLSSPFATHHSKDHLIFAMLVCLILETPPSPSLKCSVNQGVKNLHFCRFLSLSVIELKNFALGNTRIEPSDGAVFSLDMRHIQYQGETLIPSISVWAGIR